MTQEEYQEQNQCSNWTSIYSCYGNLDPLVYRDCNSIPFGVPLVEGSVHEVFLKNLEVKLIGFNNVFKQGRTRNFRTEKEKVYQLYSDPIPEWLMEEVDAVFTRGEVYIGGSGGVGGTKYLVKDTSFELVNACLRLWKPSATFHTHCGMPFSCEEDPCIVESGESGEESGTPETCCDPTVDNAEVDGSDEGNIITVTFTACTPTPSGGYYIQWRVAGSSDAYITVGPFTSSPTVFIDGTNINGTQYEGFIRSDCGGGVLGSNIPWSTNTITVVITNANSAVNVTAVSGIPGFTYSPVTGSFSQTGSHTAFTGSIGMILSGGSVSGCMRFKKNGSVFNQQVVGSAGSYSAPSETFALGDTLEIFFYGGSCF